MHFAFHDIAYLLFQYKNSILSCHPKKMSFGVLGLGHLYPHMFLCIDLEPAYFRYWVSPALPECLQSLGLRAYPGVDRECTGTRADSRGPALWSLLSCGCCHSGQNDVTRETHSHFLLSELNWAVGKPVWCLATSSLWPQNSGLPASLQLKPAGPLQPGPLWTSEPTACLA